MVQHIYFMEARYIGGKINVHIDNVGAVTLSQSRALNIWENIFFYIRWRARYT